MHWRERGSVALAFILCAVEVFHRVGFSAVLKRSFCCSIKKWKEERQKKKKKSECRILDSKVTLQAASCSCANMLNSKCRIFVTKLYVSGVLSHLLKSREKYRMSNFESLFAAQLQNTESRLLSQGERYGEKVEIASQFFVTKLIFCSRFCESIVASIATGSDLLLSFCASA